MTTQSTNACLRGLPRCTPLSNLSSDCGPESFVCVGYNHPDDRTVATDRFTLCWKNSDVDERGHWDRRDLLDTMSVISQALSTDENIRVNQDATDDEMNLMKFV